MLLLLACTGADRSTESGPADSSPDTEPSICGDAAVDTWEAGMSRAGENGVYTFTLVAVDPAPPDKGDNVWTLHIDGDAPVEGATVTLTPFMPAHGHGTTPADFSATDAGGGDYVSDPFDLFMGGVWETTVQATGDGYDSVVFTFCIEG